MRCDDGVRWKVILKGACMRAFVLLRGAGVGCPPHIAPGVVQAGNPRHRGKGKHLLFAPRPTRLVPPASPQCPRRRFCPAKQMPLRCCILTSRPHPLADQHCQTSDGKIDVPRSGPAPHSSSRIWTLPFSRRCSPSSTRYSTHESRLRDVGTASSFKLSSAASDILHMSRDHMAGLSIRQQEARGIFEA